MANGSFRTVEVFRYEGDDAREGPVYVVLSSKSDTDDGELECEIGYSNDPARCDRWVGWGFPLVEAWITQQGRELEIRSAAFPRPGPAEAASHELVYDQLVLHLKGVNLEQDRSFGWAIQHSYRQSRQTLDPVLPASCIRTSSVAWRFDRRGIALPRYGNEMVFTGLRWPAMQPEEVRAEKAWAGVVIMPDESPPLSGRPITARVQEKSDRPEQVLSARITSKYQEKADRPKQFGPPSSMFRKIEVLGVRLDLPREDALSETRYVLSPDVDLVSPIEDILSSGPHPSYAIEDISKYDNYKKYLSKDELKSAQEAKLFALMSPLNFHLTGNEENSKRPDFYYRRATRAITIELLRYGRMSIGEAVGELTTDDFESQHELLVRLVVGRIDEDAAQAQEGATFVPAIFVDNSWSKFLGRQFNGLDKRLAYFCTRDSAGESVPLSPRDAADPDAVGGSRPTPPLLANVAQVRLARRTLPERPDGPEDVKVDKQRKAGVQEMPVLLEIDCDPAVIDGWNEFDLAPTDAALRNSPVAAGRWRQDDFKDAEVRRDFARAAGSGSTGSFLGIQSAPVGDSAVLAAWKDTTTWITARYAIAGSAMMARPRGVITLTLRRLADGSVEGWDRVCDVLNVPKEETDGDGQPMVDRNGQTKPGSAQFSLGPGSWYRLLYDMDLTLENGLE
jgi:hypothetical protein